MAFFCEISKNSSTVVSVAEGANNMESTKEQIFENIRLHKEVLQSVKMQPWSMRRKLRLVRQVCATLNHVVNHWKCNAINCLYVICINQICLQAREYIARHEGALQERFAMSRSTKDLWARFKIVLTVVSILNLIKKWWRWNQFTGTWVFPIKNSNYIFLFSFFSILNNNLKKWQHFRRELVNLSTLFVPWQLRIKEIESHFGSVVASYFTFLRWLFWVNIVLAFTLSTFVILPEVILL